MTAAECAETTVTAVEQLLPALAAGLKNNASQPGGLENLMAALSGGSHQQYLVDPSGQAGQQGHQGLMGMLTPLLDSNKDGSVTT